MLLEIRQQKNNTVVIRAPDDTIYAYPLDVDNPDETLKQIGKCVLQILGDPEMPKATVSTAGGVSQGAAPGDLEGNVRRTLDSVVPNGSKVLDFLQSLSGDGK